VKFRDLPTGQYFYDETRTSAWVKTRPNQARKALEDDSDYAVNDFATFSPEELCEPSDNLERAHRSALAIRAVQDHAHCEQEPRDLLTDLMHYCTTKGLDFQHELEIAIAFYKDETCLQH
jgi:hypothetical protein